MEPIVQLHNIEKSYGQVHVLHSIDLAPHPEQVVAIVGPSGAGKTTLLQIMGTILRPDKGTISIAGQELTNLRDRELSHFRNQTIGFVFQFHHLLAEFTALDNVCLPALIGRTHLSAARKRAKELLDYLGLSHRLSHKPTALSGGEQQRVAIARALMNKPALILADEPSGNLDTQNRNELHELFFRLRDEMKQTFVIVTHDDTLAKQADSVVRIENGCLSD